MLLRKMLPRLNSNLPRIVDEGEELESQGFSKICEENISRILVYMNQCNLNNVCIFQRQITKKLGDRQLGILFK